MPTRDEWCKMWEAVKKIEQLSSEIIDSSASGGSIKRAVVIRSEVNFIKKQIQSVMGQME